MKHGGDIYSNTIEYDFSVNMNPLDCSGIVNEIVELSKPLLGNYPDIEQRAFREKVALYEGLDIGEVWGTNGASEAFMAISSMLKPSSVLLAEPSFYGYKHCLKGLTGCLVKTLELKEDNDFELTTDFTQTLQNSQVEMVILTNPNNPTGKAISEDMLKEILDICKARKIYLLMDQCFLSMSERPYSLSKYIGEYSGIYIVSAFTKTFSIPGVRVGYILSQRENIERIQDFLPEWNLSLIAQKAGEVCADYLLNKNWEEQTRKIVQEEKEFLTGKLTELGYKVYSSDTVFLLIHTDEDIYEYLLQKKILIRDCSDFEGLGRGFYRIAIKDHEANEHLIKALKARK